MDLIGLSIERPILDHHPKAHVHEIRRISYGFHEIRRISYGFHTDFMKSGRFHTDFTLKSSGFHPEIRRISWNPWNPVDFRWNPADFTQISPVKSKNYKSKCFSKNSSVWWMQGGGYDQGFHEIRRISREIRRISWNPLKSGGFHVKSKDLLQGIVTLCFYFVDLQGTILLYGSVQSTTLH